MKTIIILTTLLFVSCASIPSGYMPVSQNENETIYQRYDEFQQVSFIQHRQFFKSNPIGIYIVKANKPYTRITFDYKGENWIFFKRAVLINSEGVVFKLDVKRYDKKTDVSSPYVYESYDKFLPKAKLLELRKVVTGENVRLRLSGERVKEYNIKPVQLSALRQMSLLALNVSVE
jgi:hypothetical protein